MKSRTLYFTAPRQIEIREHSLPALAPDQVLVETICSAISPGSEMLIYRGQFPKGLPDSDDYVSSGLHYPLAYGYANVGRVIGIGKSVGREWEGRLVFAFQPHTSHFVATPDRLLPIPDAHSSETACILPNMETAINLVQDAAPILGERVLVLGQGVIGILVTALLKEFPLETLVSADHYELRRKASPAKYSLDSSQAKFHEQARPLLKSG